MWFHFVYAFMDHPHIKTIDPCQSHFFSHKKHHLYNNKKTNKKNNNNNKTKQNYVLQLSFCTRLCCDGTSFCWVGLQGLYTTHHDGFFPFIFKKKKKKDLFAFLLNLNVFSIFHLLGIVHLFAIYYASCFMWHSYGCKY